MSENNQPRVGLGVIIKRENKVLLGQRIGSHEEGTWCFPGGHLEFFETLEECALRETREELGDDFKIVNLSPVTFTNDIFPQEKKHYITLYLTADYQKGEAQIMEPDKCLGWDWFYWNNLPNPLFIPLQNLLKQNYNPFI